MMNSKSIVLLSAVCLFWVVFMSLINVVPAVGVPIKEFMDSITLFIWRSDENINFYRPWPVAVAFFYPVYPFVLLKLIKFSIEVYRVRVQGKVNT